MKKVLLILLSILVLLTSCDLTMQNAPQSKPKIYFVGIGLDYKTWNRNPDTEAHLARSVLPNTQNDLDAMKAQIENLAKAANYDYRIITYDDFGSTVKQDQDFGADFNYDFYFKSYSGHFTGKVEANGKPIYETSSTWNEEYVYDDSIANRDADGNPHNVSLQDFAEHYTNALHQHITNKNTEIPTENDIIIFYYTGHGIENGLGPALYYQTGYEKNHKNPDPADEGIALCMDKAAVEGPDKNFIMPIPYLYLDKYFYNNYQDTKIITLFDCCYSGYAIDNSDLGSIENFNTHVFGGKIRDDKLEVPSIYSIFNNTYNATFGNAPTNKNIYHLTAAHATQTSFDKDLNITQPNQDSYGAFTYQVLSYLDYDLENNCTGAPRKKVYSLNEMFSYVYDNISYDTKTYATPNVTRSRFDHAIFVM